MRAGSAEPWRPSDAPGAVHRRSARGIVGLEITVTRVEGKAKLSQNRSEADRRGVVTGLLGERTTAGPPKSQRRCRPISSD